MELTQTEIEELDALAGFNDVIKGPTAIHRMHLTGESNYASLIERGFVVMYARPPKGWGSKNFFGARITKAGRAMLALRPNPQRP